MNIKSLGAAGDGVTDDTTAINAAIQQAPQNAILYFPNAPISLAAPCCGSIPTGYLTFQGES